MAVLVASDLRVTLASSAEGVTTNMAQIPPTLGAGGANINPTGGAEPTLLEILDDVAADLEALQPDAVAADDAVAVTATTITAVATPDATDLTTAQDLANANKAKINELVTRVNDLSAEVNRLVTLANEIKTRLNAPAAATRLTVASSG